MIPRAGGPQQMPGDYLYYNGRAFKLQEGSWGLIRVYGAITTTLQPLPGHEAIPKAASSLCPADAPQQLFNVAAVEVPLPMLADNPGKVYILQADKAALLAGAKPAEPLVLHVNVGDCILIRLANETAEGAVSFHADLLAVDPRDSLGVEAGFNPSQAAAPGETRTYTYYAHPEIGETVALVRDWGNVLVNPRLGLYGAMVVGPRGAAYTDPLTGADASMIASWRVEVHPPDAPAYRDFTLFFQDEDAVIGTHLMPYNEHVQGVVGLNYRRGPLTLSFGRNGGVPLATTTPLLEAFVGDRVRVHVLAPYSEQAHVFTVEGHEWPREPGRAGSDRLDAMQIGALAAETLIFVAGGRAALPGDYLYGDHREPYREAGLWGIFRVYAPGDVGALLQPLSSTP
jgi:hypothetical protein